MMRITLAVLVALLTLAGGTSAQAPKSGGQLVHGSVQEPDRIWGPVTGLTVLGRDQPARERPRSSRSTSKLEYVPSLATEVPTVDNGGVSKDGLRYTFKLRQGVKWHDGQPFTAGGRRLHPQRAAESRRRRARARGLEQGHRRSRRPTTPPSSSSSPPSTRRSSIAWPRSASCRSTSSASCPAPTSRRTSGSARRSGSGRSSSRSGSPGSHLVLGEEPELLEAGPALPRPHHLQDRPRRQRAAEPARDRRRRHARAARQRADRRRARSCRTSASSPTPSVDAVAPLDEPHGGAVQRQEGAPGAGPRLRQGAAREDASSAATSRRPGGSAAADVVGVQPERRRTTAFDPAKAKRLLDEAGWKIGRRRRAREGRQAAELRDREHRGRAGARPGAVVHPAAVEADRRGGEDPHRRRRADVGPHAARSASSRWPTPTPAGCPIPTCRPTTSRRS